MSFGFGIGDFIAVFDRANRIRANFSGAPAQFKALSDELRNLTIIVNDVKVDLVNAVLGSEQQVELQEISSSCNNVLLEIEKTIDRYSTMNDSQSFKRIWKRLRWEPDDIRDLRNRLCSNIGLLNAINGRITRDGVMEILDSQRNEQDQKCLQWLSPMNYAIHQSDFISRRQQGTGEWLLKSTNFLKWSEGTAKTLFCPGIPGAGKTILSSVVIDYLQTEFGNDPTVGIAYIFCTFQCHDDQKQKPEALLGIILRQLVEDLPSIPENIKTLYSKRGNKGARPSFNEISTALRSVVGQLSQVWIVIDALDECDRLTASQILDELFEIQMIYDVHLLATSRFIPEITIRFEHSLTQEIRAVKSDVTTYVNSNLKRLPVFVSRDQHLQQDIVKVITNTVDGMFLLAKLSLDSLVGKRSARAIIRELDELADGSPSYDTAYDKAMKRIEDQGPDRRDMAIETLYWINCANRSLTTLELLHALAVELGESEFHEDNLPDLDDVISVCAGLITVTPDSSGDRIRLIHQTTKEYFERNGARWFSIAPSNIATICVTYLSFDVFKTGVCLSDTEFETRLDQYPLYSYAAKNWGNHARAQPINEILLMAFLGDMGKVSASVQANFSLCGFSSFNDRSQQIPLDFTGLHLAAYFGLDRVVQFMILHTCHLYGMDSMGRTPFTWAVFAGHGEIVKLLMSSEHCIDANLCDLEGRTTISLAASSGWAYILNLLLDYGVDPNSRDVDGQTPLSWAAYRGHSEVVQLLLKRGANPDHMDEYGKTPLSWAAADGWVDIVQLLLERSVDVNSRDLLGRTPYFWAAENGHTAVMRLLFQNGAQPNRTYIDGHTPSFRAAHYGYENVLQLPHMKTPSPMTPVVDDMDIVMEIPRQKLPQSLPTCIPDQPFPKDKKVESANRIKLECPLCPVESLPIWSSYSRTTLWRHVEARHYPRFTFLCNQPSCIRTFHRRDIAIQHYRVEHSMNPGKKAFEMSMRPNPYPSECPLCKSRVISWAQFISCVLSHSKAAPLERIDE